jgi:hypothetical protein
MNLERQKSEVESQRSEGQPARKTAGKKLSPEIESRYRMLSPMMKETVDNLVSSGLSVEKVINGLRS